MNINFNRQFLLTDFRLLDNRDFIRFVKSREYATYIVLRRNVWRSPEPHYMGLHELYSERRLLASSLIRKEIANALLIEDESEVSRMLTSLEKKGIIKRVRTGRQSIYILGEWIDVLRDGSYRGVEWFYIDGVFGISKEDIEKGVNIDGGKGTHQTWGNTPHQHRTSTIGGKSPSQSSAPTPLQRRAKSPHNNITDNRDENTVNGHKRAKESGESSQLASATIKQLQDQSLPREKVEYIAREVAQRLGDKKSLDFFRLVAAKIPEAVIWQNLSELEHDGVVDNPRKLFTYRMGRYAALTPPSNKTNARRAD